MPTTGRFGATSSWPKLGAPALAETFPLLVVVHNPPRTRAAAAVVVTAGAGGGGGWSGAAVATKTWVVHTRPPEMTWPMPTALKGPRRFARWTGEPTNDEKTVASSRSKPTFSALAVQGMVSCWSSDGLWDMVLVVAMDWVHAWATWLSRLSSPSGESPFCARNPLMRDSQVPGVAAAGDAPTPSRIAAARATAETRAMETLLGPRSCTSIIIEPCPHVVASIHRVAR